MRRWLLLGILLLPAASGAISLSTEATEVALRHDGFSTRVEATLRVDCASLWMRIDSDIDTTATFDYHLPDDVLMGGPIRHRIPPCTADVPEHMENIVFDIGVSGPAPALTPLPIEVLVSLPDHPAETEAEATMALDATVSYFGLLDTKVEQVEPGIYTITVANLGNAPSLVQITDGAAGGVLIGFDKRTLVLEPTSAGGESDVATVNALRVPGGRADVPVTLSPEAVGHPGVTGPPVTVTLPLRSSEPVQPAPAPFLAGPLLVLLGAMRARRP